MLRYHCLVRLSPSVSRGIFVVSGLFFVICYMVYWSVLGFERLWEDTFEAIGVFLSEQVMKDFIATFVDTDVVLRCVYIQREDMGYVLVMVANSSHLGEVFVHNTIFEFFRKICPLAVND